MRGNLHVSHLGEHEGKFDERCHEDLIQDPPLGTVHIEGALYFDATDGLEQLLDALSSRCPNSDPSVAARALVGKLGRHRLRQVATNARHNVRIMLCAVRDDMFQVLDVSGIVKLLGAENASRAGSTLLGSTQSAVQHAKDYN